MALWSIGLTTFSKNNEKIHTPTVFWRIALPCAFMHKGAF